MIGRRLAKLIGLLMFIIILFLLFQNYQMKNKYAHIEKNLLFHELDTVVLKVKYIRYACGECFPDYFFVENVLYSEFTDSTRYLGREILADFLKEEDKDIVLNSTENNNTFVFYGEIRSNNYDMLKIKVASQESAKDLK